MAYKIVTTKKFNKAFDKLDGQTRKIISSWARKNLIGCDNPRIHGKALTGNFKGLWRYRVVDYRLLAEIKDDRVVIFLLDIGHRREVYD